MVLTIDAPRNYRFGMGCLFFETFPQLLTEEEMLKELYRSFECVNVSGFLKN